MHEKVNVRFKRTQLHRVEKVGYKVLLDSTQPNVPECLEILRILTTHSKLLSTRNDSGITPKGPMGPWVPWPLGAEGALSPLAQPPQGPIRSAEGAMGPLALWPLDPLATRSVARQLYI